MAPLNGFLSENTPRMQQFIASISVLLLSRISTSKRNIKGLSLCIISTNDAIERRWNQAVHWSHSDRGEEVRDPLHARGPHQCLHRSPAHADGGPDEGTDTTACETSIL